MIDKKLNEALKSQYSPEGSEVRELQMRMLEMLKYIDKFCTEHDIKYWLAYGSCLGAVRHEGFIPWDDDMDIEMLREDYDKFVSLRKEFENDQFVLQDHISDDEYITPFPKIRDKNSYVKEVHNRDKYFKHNGVFIDLFVRERNTFIAQRISHIAQYVSYILTDINNNMIRKIIKHTIYLGLHNLLFPILNIYNKLSSNRNLLHPGLGYGFYKSINRKNLFPLKRMQFENGMYPIPGNYEDYLTRLYGDYMKIPDNKEDFRIHFKIVDLNRKHQ